MAFTHNCSGFAAHQDVAYFDAVGVDYSRTLTLTALRHPVDRVISAYFYSLRVDAPFLEGYKPQNDTDFTGLMRFVEENPIDSNNLMTQHLGGSRHCNWPGIAPAPPREQRLEAAKRNLARICVIILSVSPAAHTPRSAAAGRWAGWRRRAAGAAASRLLAVAAVAAVGFFSGGRQAEQQPTSGMCADWDAPTSPLPSSTARLTPAFALVCCPACRNSWMSRWCGWPRRAAGRAGGC